MTEVIIDGVRYLPAHELTPPTLADVRRLLIELYMGAEVDVDGLKWDEDIGRTLWITVTEDRPDTSYPDLEPTIDRFIEMATERLLVQP